MQAESIFSAQTRRKQNIMLSGVVILLLGLGWYFMIRQFRIVSQTTVAVYQQTQLEIVRAVARSVENYVHDQTEHHGRPSLVEFEQEIFSRFIAPVQLLSNSDAWIYAPDHIIFDRSSNFPEAYRDKSMVEIFALQAELGASHYEEITEAVLNAREGVGWYIWQPDKGQEIAAWTPVVVGDYIWTIGLSTPLPEILASTGATHQLRTSVIFMAIGNLIILGFLIAWRRSADRHLQAVEALGASETKFRTLATTTAAAIFIYQGTRNRYVNPAAEAVTGYSHSELLAMDFWDVIHPDFRERIKEQGQARQRGEPISPRHELKLLTKAGEVRWVDVTLAVIEFERKLAVLGTAFDITARKQAEAERERLLAAEREQRLLAETLGEVFLTLTARTSREAVLDEILRQVRRVVSYSAANVMLLQGNMFYSVRSQGYRSWGNNNAESLADFPLEASVVQSRQALVVPDTRQYPDWAAVEAVAWIRSFVAIPICLHKRVLGLLRLDSNIPNNFSNKDVKHLQPLVNAAAIALENARLYEQTRQELEERRQAEKEILELNRKLLALQYAGAAIASSLDLPYVLSTVTREMINLLEVESCAISQWNQRANTISVIAEQGFSHWRDDRQLADRIYDLANYPLTKQVLVRRQVQQMRLSQAGIDPDELAYMRANHIKSLLMLPMEFQDRVVGLVEVMDSRLERAFTVEEIGLAQFLANQAATAIENARLYDRVRQELDERVQTQNELQRVLGRNQAILDAIPDSMLYFNTEEQLLEYKLVDDILSPDGLSKIKIGEKLDHLWPPDIVDLTRQHMAQVLASGQVQVFEYQLSSPGGLQDFEARLVASGSDEVLAVIRNITERKQAERNVIRAERLAALGQLAATLAHEINNPLQAMQSNLDLILDFPLEPGESEKYLQIIRHEIERLRDIAQRVLNYAHPKPAPRRQLNIATLVQQVLSLTNKRLEQKGIRVTTDFREVPAVRAAPDQLMQVFLNLVINATEVLTHNGQLHIAIYPAGNDVAISFTNNGPVIPQEILTRIFEPFFTTKPEGSGLGLWVSHSLVQQHSGSLTVENLGERRGVIFTVKLPVAS